MPKPNPNTPSRMAYITMADMAALIPGPFLVEALDDDGDNRADVRVWNSVAREASGAVDALIGGRYNVPFRQSIPSVVLHATKIFAAELLYKRRGKAGKDNPHTEEADQLRAKLEAIGKGEQPLSPNLQRQQPSVSVVGEKAKTTPAKGGLNI